MAEEKIFIIAIFLMMLVTYIPRVMPLHVKSRHWPSWLRDSVEFLPVALVGAIVIPGLMIDGGTIDLITPKFAAFIPTILVAYYTKNLIYAVLAGTITFILIERFMVVS
jgi:branched-subunit amino acid transport protein